MDKASESNKIEETILRVIEAGERAVEELIKVAEEESIKRLYEKTIYVDYPSRSPNSFYEYCPILAKRLEALLKRKDS